MNVPVTIQPVVTKADRKAFVDFAFTRYANDPNWVPPLKDEVHGLINPKSNPWFGHAEAVFLLAKRGGKVVGRISAQVDQLVLAMPVEQGGGPGVGHWGMFEAEDAETAAALIAAAEQWLRDKGMTRAIGPMSLSVWDEPGLLVKGADHPPTVMMGHHDPAYQAWVEAAGYAGAKDLFTYDLDITPGFPPLIERIVSSGERNARINIRKVDKSRFAEEAALILSILNDAWSDNWGFVPFTDREIAYAGAVPVGGLPDTLLDCPSDAWIPWRRNVFALQKFLMSCDSQLMANSFRNYMSQKRNAARMSKALNESILRTLRSVQ